jgi:hypothetical protein
MTVVFSLINCDQKWDAGFDFAAPAQVFILIMANCAVQIRV